jgi:hypothetical protein
MKTIVKLIAYLGLTLTLLPSLLFLTGAMTLEALKLTMLAGTILWLVSAPIGQKLSQQASPS